MEKQVPNTELKSLSASRVKTLENCSWLYWCNYHLKLPQEKNEGAKKGDICHDIFELLLKKDRKHLFDKMILVGSVTACPAIERLIKRYIKKCKLHDTTAGFQQIDEMIMVGLKSDFYVKGGTLVAPEFKFDLASEKPKFRIKSSKRKFAGEDQESNLQALFYSFAATQLFPHLTPTVRFIFLQYPQDPMMTVQFTPDALLGFKYYLEATQLKVEGFNEYAAKNHFAFDHPAVKDEFKGKSLCGFASRPGQLKKDGTKMWHCPYRFAYDYYALKKDGKIISCAFTQEELRPKNGETVEKLHYDGCPRHINPLDSFSPTPIKKTTPVKTGDVWDGLF